MKYDFEILHWAVDKHQAACALSRLLIKVKDDSNINDEILVIVFDTRAQKIPSKVLGDTLKQAYIETNEPALRTLAEFISAQSTDAYSDIIRPIVWIDRSSFNLKKSGLLMSLSPIYGSLQNVVPQSLRSIILNLADNPTLPGHSGEFRMYDTLRSEYSWRNMSTDVHNKVRHCQHWPRMGIKFKNQRQLQLFLPSGSIELIVIDIIGPLRITKLGNQYVKHIINRYRELARAVLTTNISSIGLAYIFSSHWVIPYGTPDILLSEIVQQFATKCFISLGN